ncbi:MAG: hypothetical protein ACFFF4_12520 [Candidatus Thorarchaeota archaeon]
MKRLLNAIDRISTPRNLVLAILIAALSVGTMAILTENLVYSVYGAADMPDTNFGYTYDDILQAFDILGPEGLQAWLQVHLLDLIFPLGYSFAIAFAIMMELRIAFPERGKLRSLALFSLIAAFFDYTENTLIASQAVSYPNISLSVISIASSVTILKWLFLYSAFAIVFLLIPVVAIRKIRK